MPFRRKGKRVYVLKDGRWKLHQAYKTVADAILAFKFLVSKYSDEQKAYNRKRRRRKRR